jgi:hypothetical protein
MENPRSTEPSGVFNVTITDNYDRVIYYWSSASSPTVVMKTAAAPTAISFTRTSEANGNYNTYTFEITNNNVYQEGDQVSLTLPDGMLFKSDSECSSFVGFTAESCSISTNLQTMYFTVAFSGSRLLASGVSGNTWGFSISNVKNPPSTQTWASVSYIVQTADGYKVEEESTELGLTNTSPGEIAYTTAGAIPQSFTQGEETTYAISFVPANYL